MPKSAKVKKCFPKNIPSDLIRTKKWFYLFKKLFDKLAQTDVFKKVLLPNSIQSQCSELDMALFLNSDNIIPKKKIRFWCLFV